MNGPAYIITTRYTKTHPMGLCDVSRDGVALATGLQYHEAVIFFRGYYATDLLRTFVWHPSYDPEAGKPTFRDEYE